MPSELITTPSGKVRQAGADIDRSDDLRREAEHSLYVFSKGILGMDKFVAHLHAPLCRWLQTCPPRRKLLLTPRDTFKTTMARCLGMWITIQPAAANPFFPGREGRNLRILYAAENDRRALSRIGWIRRQYENNKLFRALWPHLVWPTTAESNIWTGSSFALPRSEDYPEGTFEAAGVDSGTTGGHYDVIVKDDLIGLRSRKQPQLMVAAVDWWKTSHSLWNEPSESLDFVFGTRWAAEDLYSWIFENEHAYDIRIYSATARADSLPPSGHPDSALLFPERLDRATLETNRSKYGELYYLNYENRAVGGGTTAFNMDVCGTCDVAADGTINYEANALATRIKEIVEGGEVLSGNRTANRPKPFYRMTGEERTAQWHEMIRKWREDRFNKMEVN